MIQFDDENELDECIPVSIKILLAEKASKELTDARFDALDRRLSYEADARQKAVDKAEESTQTALKKAEMDNTNRFANTNEWRASMKDLQSNFVTRAEIKNIEDKVASHITRSEHEGFIKEVESRVEKAETEVSAKISTLCVESDRKLKEVEGRCEKTQTDLATQIATLRADFDRKNDQRYVTWGGIVITLLMATAALLGLKTS